MDTLGERYTTGEVGEQFDPELELHIIRQLSPFSGVKFQVLNKIMNFYNNSSSDTQREILELNTGVCKFLLRSCSKLKIINDSWRQEFLTCSEEVMRQPELLAATGRIFAKKHISLWLLYAQLKGKIDIKI